MVSENEVTDDWRFAGLTVRRHLKTPSGDRGQAYIDEDKIIPYGEVLNDTKSFRNRQIRQTFTADPSCKGKKATAQREGKSNKDCTILYTT